MLQHLPPVQRLRREASENQTVLSLRIAITVVALFYIALAWSVNNKWFLAGLFFWEAAP